MSNSGYLFASGGSAGPRAMPNKCGFAA